MLRRQRQRQTVLMAIAILPPPSPTYTVATSSSLPPAVCISFSAYHCVCLLLPSIPPPLPPSSLPPSLPPSLLPSLLLPPFFFLLPSLPPFLPPPSFQQVQLTDFENAAFVVFIVLLTRTILSFGLNFLIPISKVGAGTGTASKQVDSLIT